MELQYFFTLQELYALARKPKDEASFLAEVSNAFLHGRLRAVGKWNGRDSIQWCLLSPPAAMALYSFRFYGGGCLVNNERLETFGDSEAGIREVLALCDVCRRPGRLADVYTELLFCPEDSVKVWPPKEQREVAPSSLPKLEESEPKTTRGAKGRAITAAIEKLTRVALHKMTYEDRIAVIKSEVKSATNLPVSESAILEKLKPQFPAVSRSFP